jgi:hypothetical protein
MFKPKIKGISKNPVSISAARLKQRKFSDFEAAMAAKSW